MSYILDALKKAEQERGTAQVPNLMTVHDFRSKARNPVRLILAAFTLCAAALLLYFLPALKTIVRHPAPVAESKTGPAAPPAVVDISRPQRAVHSGTLKESPAGEPQLPAAADTTASKKTESDQRIAPSAQARPEPAVPRGRTPRLLLNPVAAPPPANPETKPVPAEKNPASLSEAMAMMNLTVVLYSDTPAERMVFINGRKYAEGDRIDGKFLLESITLEGAVLSYRGERAMLRPKQNSSH